MNHPSEANDADGYPTAMGATVRSVMTSVATYEWACECHPSQCADKNCGTKESFMETRVFTHDGTEHYLLWPLEAALPLLNSIMETAMTVIGKPAIYAESVGNYDADTFPWSEGLDDGAGEES